MEMVTLYTEDLRLDKGDIADFRETGEGLSSSE